jgi:hypothetical protein
VRHGAESLRPVGWRTVRRLVAVVALWLLLPAAAWAHKPSDSYLAVAADGANPAVQWDIALRDLDFAIGLDADNDGALTWGEVRSQKDAIAAYALSRLAVSSAGGTCSPGAVALLIDEHSDGAYAVLRFPLACPDTPVDALTVDYSLLFDRDAQHRGILSVRSGDAQQLAILSPEARNARVAIGGGPWAAFAAFVRGGIEHVWSGYDHVLFMAVMLLPAVLRRRAGGAGWEVAPAFFQALLDTLKIVTAFTLAHAVALTLALLGYVSIPSRIVESGVALSIVLAAVDNIRPIFGSRRWAVAFCFGLVHGSGYAATLSALDLAPMALAIALAGFNVGVEIAQLTVAGLVFPAGFAIRHWRLYRQALMPVGSLAAGALAAVWFVDRAFGIRFVLW